MVEIVRRFERKRVLRRAKIVFRNGHGVVDCVLLDLSEGGARLKSPGLMGIPDRFQLRIDNGPSFEVEIAFRTFDTAGVRFLKAA